MTGPNTVDNVFVSSPCSMNCWLVMLPLSICYVRFGVYEATPVSEHSHFEDEVVNIREEAHSKPCRLQPGDEVQH